MELFKKITEKLNLKKSSEKIREQAKDLIKEKFDDTIQGVSKKINPEEIAGNILKETERAMKSFPDKSEYKKRSFAEKINDSKAALQFGWAIAKPMIGGKGIIFLLIVLYFAICGIIFNLQLIF